MGVCGEQRARIIIVTGSAGNGEDEGLEPCGAGFWSGGQENVSG